MFFALGVVWFVLLCVHLLSSLAERLWYQGPGSFEAISIVKRFDESWWQFRQTTRTIVTDADHIDMKSKFFWNALVRLCFCSRIDPDAVSALIDKAHASGAWKCGPYELVGPEETKFHQVV